MSLGLSDVREVLGADVAAPSPARRGHYLLYLLKDGGDIRAVQELPGRIDVATTMIYTHALPLSLPPLRRARGIRSWRWAASSNVRVELGRARVKGEIGNVET